MTGLHGAVAHCQFHLVATGRAIPARRHHGYIRHRLILARFQEQDVTRRRNFPGDAVAERHMGDFFVRRELDLYG
ncbi:hypothetical protein D3C87_1771270 [compost metagenome]